MKTDLTPIKGSDDQPLPKKTLAMSPGGVETPLL